MTTKVQAPNRAADDDSGKDTLVMFRGEEGRRLLERFPARVRPGRWPMTAADREEVLARIDQPPLRAQNDLTQENRRSGARRLLDWLETFPGVTWQQRWQASPAAVLGAQWIQAPAAWLTEQGNTPLPAKLRSGLLCLSVADAIRPDLDFLLTTVRSGHWHAAVAAHRDPPGFARLESVAGRDLLASEGGRIALGQIAKIIIAKGGGVADITVGDCLELRKAELDLARRRRASRHLFYSLLKELGLFPPDAPATLRSFSVFSGQLTPEQLIDSHKLACQPVRDLLVDYLTERQSTLDYVSLRGLVTALAMHFWKNLETYHPGIDSLHLPRDVATAWKQRLRTKVTRRRLPDGTVAELTSPRDSYLDILSKVRGFYLDIAEWALDEPARWGPWAAPSPVSGNEISFKKRNSRRKSKMDQRTRERLPVLPTLVSTAEQRLQDARTRLEAVRAASAGGTFTVLGETFVKTTNRYEANPDNTVFVYDDTGRRRDLGREEHRAFFGWAAIEFLRNTGVRIEEMLETSHHSITQYRLPTTGELIPLLQIAPSKNDEERLLVVGPELADVLSAIISRIRGEDGAVPLIPFYDRMERVWIPPLPLLFQWCSAGDQRAVSATSIRRAIDEILIATGLTDAAGQPLSFQLHDFRRLFTTEAIMNGMPPHIAQLLLGHKDINTTMGYKAVYPEEAINGHRAFIARRRALRPSEEYRTPTDEEWDEFLGHFERRKVALGECGRAYGTSCQHEHSCVRCPVLRVAPDQRRRLEEIRDNLTARIAEAEREGWRGEAENLGVSLAHANDKLAQLDVRARRAATINLGIPTFGEITGRTANPLRPTRPATDLVTAT